MNKYQLPFMRLQSTLDLGIKSQISTEFGTAIINKKQLQDDMIVLRELVDRATPMKPYFKIDDEGDYPFKQYYCKKCDSQIRTILFNGPGQRPFTPRCQFCEDCGQAIDWSDK